MPVPTIPTLPAWPSRNERPEVFNAKVNAFLPGLNPFGVAVRAVGQFVEQIGQSVSAAADQVLQSLQTITALRNQTEAFAITAINAPGTSATSTAALTLGLGLRAGQVQPNKQLRQGQYISWAVSTDGTKRMLGPIKSYDPATGALEFVSEAFFGTGSYSAWTIALSAPASIPVADPVDYWLGLDNSKALTSATAKAINEYRPRANATSLAWDLSAHGLRVSTVLSSGSHTEALPSGLKVGDVIAAQYQQPASGGAAAIVFPSAFKFGQFVGAPVANPTANAISVMRGEVMAISPAIIIDAQFKNL